MRDLDPTRAWRALADWQQDVVLGLGGAALAVGGLLIEIVEWEPWTAAADPLGVGLMVVCGGALGGARRWPLVAGFLSAAAFTVAAGIDYSVWISGLLSTFIVGVCAAHTSRRATVVLGGLVIALAIGLLIREGEVTPSELLSSIALAAVPVAIGDAFRVRRELAAEAEARAERLEQLREMELSQAVGEERLRIARDVHDVVGHHLSAIAIQAGVGERLAAAGDEDAAGTALATIRGLTATALAETRRLLGLVRADAERRAPGLLGAEEIEDLARRNESEGLEVTVRRVGEERALDGVLGDCAYRIVQEALTNVCRHAAAAHAAVELRYGPRGLELVIEDDGIGGSGAAEVGYGLIGMRERVGVVGGELVVGPRPERGWRVHASLPYEQLATR
ncbi:MAG: sensor histidine kinase [Actinobacteria bacterium]|nr:sensor histidine kinase [Actinomycetota bacterium]